MTLELYTDKPFEGFELDEEYEFYYEYEDIDIDIDDAVDQFIAMFNLSSKDIKFEWENIEDFQVCNVTFEINGQSFHGVIV